jgi:uncharacterized protein (TIGR03083 family)
MGEIAQEATAGRQRITELVVGLDEATAKMPVPTCPEWSIADVVAHMVGVCADVLAGNIEGVATDPWTAAQVEARRGRSIKELVDEWAEVAPSVEEMAPLFPGRVPTQWIVDITSHEHDIRHALGRPGAQDTDAVSMATGFMIAGLATSVAAHGLPPLEIRAAGNSWVGGGEGEADLGAVLLGADPPIGGDRVPEATVEASEFNLFRALTGRRSLDQVRRFTWTGDAERYLPAFEFGPFKPSAVDIDE